MADTTDISVFEFNQKMYPFLFLLISDNQIAKRTSKKQKLKVLRF